MTWDQATYTANIRLSQGLSLEELNKIGESVAIIYALDKDGYFFKLGSGFVYDDLIITNHHVITDAVTLDVRFGTNIHMIPMDQLEIVHENPEADLAAFRLPGYTSLRLASDVPKIGEKVYVLGYPDGKFTITEGTIKSFDTKDGYNIIWSTALARPGNSGGAMINSKGEIIGLVRGTDGVNDKDSFALHLKHLVEELEKIN